VEVYIALAYVALGVLLGATGQLMRVVVGLKKELDEAPKIAEKKKELDEKNKKLDERIEELDEKIKAKEDKESLMKEKELFIRDKELLFKEKEVLEWFNWKQLLVSLLIAFLVGGIAGVLGAIMMVGETITKEFMVTLIAIGYAGTDFIEGFMNTRKPK
jgi:phosphate/sulfate permease